MITFESTMYFLPCLRTGTCPFGFILMYHGSYPSWPFISLSLYFKPLRSRASCAYNTILHILFLKGNRNNFSSGRYSIIAMQFKGSSRCPEAWLSHQNDSCLFCFILLHTNEVTLICMVMMEHLPLLILTLILWYTHSHLLGRQNYKSRYLYGKSLK